MTSADLKRKETEPMTDYLTRDAIYDHAEMPERTKQWLLDQHDDLDVLEQACKRCSHRMLTSPPIHPRLDEISSLADQLRAVIASVKR